MSLKNAACLENLVIVMIPAAKLKYMDKHLEWGEMVWLLWRADGKTALLSLSFLLA